MQLGLEVLLERGYSSLNGARIGLLTNPSGINQQLSSIIDLIYQHPELNLKKLFGPEHGIRGDRQAGEKVEDAVDEKTRLPMISLYGQLKRFNPEMLTDLDVIIYDMQDVGVRFYTVIYTLAYALEGVKAAGKKMIVLDRPNPIAPISIAGNIIDAEFSSFVGGYGLPIIHGMTVGELANYFNQEFAINAELEVVKMKGWNRELWYDQTPFPWVYPSPNMPTLDTAILYPGTGLFEGTNLSEGRGTTKPFELIGAPWIDAQEWSENLNQLKLPGVGFRPVYFTPSFSKYQKEKVQGVQVHILDREQVRPIQLGIEMLQSVFKLYPDHADWFTFKENYFMDKLVGGDYLRIELSKDAAESKRSLKINSLYDRLEKEWTEQLSKFSEIRDKYLLY